MSIGLVHVGDELREVNGNLITHKRPDEISQILVGILQSGTASSVHILQNKLLVKCAGQICTLAYVVLS